MGRIALFLSCLLVAGAAAASDDSFRLGGNVEITESVPGSLKVVGGTITVDGPVSGDASLAGGTIIVNGAVKDNLRAAGGHVTINASIGGNVSVAAGTLELGPLARIAGNLSFHGGSLQRDPAAQVTGTLEQRGGRGAHHSERGPFSGYGRGWFWTGGLVVLAALLAAALPGPSKRMAAELRERPWVTTLLGLVAISAIPVAAVLAMITVIGIPLGILAIVAYAALLMVGYVWLAVVVGGLLLDRLSPASAAATASRVGAAVLAMIALALLARLPFVGGLVGMIALVVGVGMIVGAALRRPVLQEEAHHLA